MIVDVIIWTNGLVVAFDESGEQVPSVQGEFWENAPNLYMAVREQSNRDSVTFRFGDWNTKTYLLIKGWDSFERLVKPIPRA